MFGDFTTQEIEYNCGIKGDVMDIGVLRTTSWKQDNGLTVICIMDVSTYCQQLCFKEPVFNYSGNFMDEIKIPVQYGSNYELAKSIILEAGIAVAESLVYNLKRNGKLCKVNTG
jgi:small-conductance mechanosensitive channel